MNIITTTHIKRQVFSNISHPSIVEMARKAGYTIKDAGSIWKNGNRVYGCFLNGNRMSYADARKLILAECEFFTFGNKPCEV